MNLISGEPFWPKLDEDIETEILVVGAGITGALIALAFQSEGYGVTVVEQNKIAHGSTSASTAMLQYEIDVNLSDLEGMIGTERARRAYHLCGEAIKKIAGIADYFHGDLQECPSLYLVKDENDLSKLREELRAREAAGFAVSWLDEKMLHENYGIKAVGGIRSELGAAINPYKLATNIFNYLRGRGIRVYEEVGIDLKQLRKGKESARDSDGEGQKIKTRDGKVIIARQIILATGYETQKFLQEKVLRLKSSFALVSEPLVVAELWAEQALVWDTAQPYLYARTTVDGRILMGGADLNWSGPVARDLMMTGQIRKIRRQFEKYFPSVKYEMDCIWGGVFGETKDGLAYIGRSPEMGKTMLALGFGGNGITYSLVAAELLVDLYREDGTSREDLELFRFGR